MLSAPDDGEGPVPFTGEVSEGLQLTLEAGKEAQRRLRLSPFPASKPRHFLTGCRYADETGEPNRYRSSPDIEEVELQYFRNCKATLGPDASHKSCARLWSRAETDPSTVRSCTTEIFHQACPELAANRPV